MEACHDFSSQAAHRHPQFFVCFSGRLMITHTIMFLVLLLHFHDTWIYSCVSYRLSIFLWPHGLIIELQYDGVSRECESF